MHRLSSLLLALILLASTAVTAAGQTTLGTHPQFFVPSLGTDGFVDLTDYLIGGEAENGTTAVLGADTIGNAEGFSAGRVVRFGVRLRF